MFKISTYFIKGQIPGVTKRYLINRYKRELDGQSVNNITVTPDTISFTNNTFRVVLNKFANKFSSFSKGQIKIVEEVDEFGIYFQADLTRLFTSAGITAAIATVFFLFGSGFNTFSFIIGLVIFVLLIAIGFISTHISFPVYFTSLRNEIERELQGDRL
jgi:ABC-type multidrug transport system fused ATPase/permease subunit